MKTIVWFASVLSPKARIRLRSPIGFTIAIIVSSVMAAQPGPIIYHLTDLGTLGGTASVANAINDAGHIVGDSTLFRSDKRHATLFDPTGLGGNVSLAPRATYSSAAAINNPAGGELIVGYVNTGGQTHASVFGFGGKVIDLGAHIIENGRIEGKSSIARAVNDAGQIVGVTSFGDIDTPRTVRRATLFDLNSALTGAGSPNRNLGYLPGGSLMSEAFAINNTEQIVGKLTGAIRNSLEERAASFDPNPGPVDASHPGRVTHLGGLAADQGSTAYGVNDFGQIVGSSFLPNGKTSATLFDPTGHGANLDLGTLGGSSRALAISNHSNQLIVGASNDRAALFGFGHQVFDLNTLIDPTDALFGMVDLYEATGINNKGQIVANGVFRGQTHRRAFLLTPED